MYELEQGMVTTKDLSPRRVFKLEGTNQEIYVDRKDPFGFWYVSLKMGTLPEHLKQAYTTFEKAKVDVVRYIEDRFAEKKVIKKKKLTPPTTPETSE